MEDLKIENARLQKLVDILDSQPELVFSVTIDGQITYMSERTAYFIKSSSSADESVDEDPTHMNQILTPESVEFFLEALREVNNHFSNDTNQLHATMEGGFGISTVRVCCFSVISCEMINALLASRRKCASMMQVVTQQ